MGELPIWILEISAEQVVEGHAPRFALSGMGMWGIEQLRPRSDEAYTGGSATRE